ncbi:hypothetical protein KJ980_02030 [Patescibacteria group bacterium]|nr:hypothetical protein [Patescibacteria group bacterium]MBU4016904.1 hypothetical protein [Patescibacteria group bacterium]MBU4098408.1 hypothetical protein [Patescibacteria group bacterium]
MKNNLKKYFPYILFFLITLSIMLPLYGHGYIFLLDMVWGPRIGLSKLSPQGINESIPLIFILQVLNSFMPSEVIQKILLSLIIFFTQVSMYKLASAFMEKKWALVSGFMYLLNPYFYERLLAGQWHVLLGYLILPLLIYFFLKFLNNPDRHNFPAFAFLYSIYPILSLHYWYIASFFLPVLFIVFLLIKRARIRTYAKFLPLLLIIFLTINLFWLARTGSAATLSAITLNDFPAYTTRPDPWYGAFFNVLSLYGFWGSYTVLPKDIFPYWFIITPLILMIASLGAVAQLKKRNSLAITLVLVFLPALIISVGYGSAFTKPVIDFLYNHLYGFNGLRDTQKAAGILALTYAFFVPLGYRLLTRRLSKNEWYGKLIFISAITIPFLMTNTIFLGFSSQVRAADYPHGWYAVNELTKKEGAVKMLFLPWHAYMRFPFSHERIVSNPAGTFFDREVVVGKGIENVYLLNQDQGIWDTEVLELLYLQQATIQSKKFLTLQGVTHIIIAKVADWEKYKFLSEKGQFEIIYEDTDIILLKL